MSDFDRPHVEALSAVLWVLEWEFQTVKEIAPKTGIFPELGRSHVVTAKLRALRDGGLAQYQRHRGWALTTAGDMARDLVRLEWIS